MSLNLNEPLSLWDFKILLNHMMEYRMFYSIPYKKIYLILLLGVFFALIFYIITDIF